MYGVAVIMVRPMNNLFLKCVLLSLSLFIVVEEKD